MVDRAINLNKNIIRLGGKLNVSILVRIPNTENKYGGKGIRASINKKTDALTINLVTTQQLVLKIDQIDYKNWHRTDSVLLDIKTIPLFINHFNKLFKILEDDIFYIQDKKIKMYKLDLNKHIISMTNLGANNLIKMRPTVVLDADSIEYEGARLVFNRSDNFVDLAYDELICLKYIVAKLDLLTLSHVTALNFLNKELVDIPIVETNDNGISTSTTVGISKKNIFEGI